MGSSGPLRKIVAKSFMLTVAACAVSQPPKEEAVPLRSLASIANADFFTSQPKPTGQHYVHFMHLDGFHSKIFRSLVDSGQLPHFQFLMLRGRYSGLTATVDKSETMKVIQSYLTSKRQTEVTGWWQFQRDQLRFVNYDTHPVGLLSYALGLQFPLRPTILDFLNSKGENLVSGFTLERRGVPFKNYSRSYYEGIRGAFEHRNFDQAYSSAGEFIKVFKTVALDNNQKLPVFSNTLLAPADEMGHWRGTVALQDNHQDDFCIERNNYSKERENDILDIIYKIIDQSADSDTTQALNGLEGRYFSKIRHIFQESPIRGPRNSGTTAIKKLKQLCFHVPHFDTFARAMILPDTGMGAATSEQVDPYYVLGMMMVDMNLGRIIDAMRSIRFKPDGTRYLETKFPHGILNYLSAGKLEDSYFERTLFLLMGDHGFGDSKHGMVRQDAKNPNPYVGPGSLPASFIEMLNQNLGLENMGNVTSAPETAKIGIDDSIQPSEISFPQLSKQLRSDPAALAAIKRAETKASDFVTDLKDAFKDEAYKKYWYLTIFKPLIIDPKIDKTFNPKREYIVNLLTQLYLRADPQYMQLENAALQQIYSKNVRLVYGGAALNNAELFIPSPTANGYSWSQRPSVDQILSYRPAGEGGARLIDVLQDRRGLGQAIGLMFIRKSNGQINPSAALPHSMEIIVRDSAGNSGLITVTKDNDMIEPLFHYQVDAASKFDPLGTQGLGDGAGTSGTYNDWNEWSIAKDFYYHNVVGGMGDYLYSSNPSIGDISLMRAQGWNFRDNGGGHGGVHKEEKLTVFLASGPGVRAGLLRSKGHLSLDNGKIAWSSNYLSHPTVLDMMPTALEWLGYDPQVDVPNFARTEFKPYLNRWIGSQRDEIVDNIASVDNLKTALKDIGFPGFRIDRFASNIKDLLAFMPKGAPENMESFENYRLDGNALDLGY